MESMKRGTVNESKAIECIRSLEFVVCCYENRMFGDKSTNWIGVSLDGIGALYNKILGIDISKDDIYEDTKIMHDSD